MTRKFKTADYEATLELKVSIRECLPPNHLARFIVNLVAQLDLSSIYNQYGAKGTLVLTERKFTPMLLRVKQ